MIFYVSCVLSLGYLHWHYHMCYYQQKLKERNIVQSMSRKGNCLDNAVIENFFGLLKSEVYYLNKYDTIEQLKADIEEYIHYYNHRRIKLSLDKKSPVQYREIIFQQLSFFVQLLGCSSFSTK